MGSLLYPALTSHSILPGMPLDTSKLAEARAETGHGNKVLDGQRTNTGEDAREELEKRHVRRRRPESLPPILQPRGSDVRVTSTLGSTSRHSMQEVVARMRVREKTLLGEDLLKRREHKDAEAEKSRYKSRRTSKDATNGNLNPVISSEWGENSPNGTKWLSEQSAISHAISYGESRTRKRHMAINNYLAWATPRENFDGASYTSSKDSPSVAKDKRTASVPLNGFHAENGLRMGFGDLHHHEQLNEGKIAGDVMDEDTFISGSDDNDVEDSDDFFDYDEGEKELETQRKEDLQSRTTEKVYKRSCESLRIQPSPAFLRQVNLTCIDLRDVSLGAPDVKPIAIALVRDVKVIYLDLSHNNIGPVGVSYIAEMLLDNTTLMTLNLSATNPGPEGVKALAQTLPNNRNLAFLKLEENKIEHTESHHLADIIKGVPNLRGLYLGHNRLGYNGGAAIATALEQNENVTVLDLHWNHIRRESAVALAKALVKNKSLKVLNLAWNGLGKEGCLALAHALPKNTSLKELDITCNRVDFMSLGFLLKGVTRNSSLNTLKIGQNPLTTDGAKALIRAMTSKPELQLSHIDLTGVPVDREFMDMVAAAQESRMLNVRHEEALTLATGDQKRDHDGTNLDRYDPVMVLFEYMRIDNLRVIDIFQYMDTRKRDKLSKADIREGLTTLKLPVTEHAVDVIHKKLDLNKDGFVELDEMMKVQRDTARQVNLRQIRAKFKKREDEGLKGLHKILRDVIAKRTEDNENSRRRGTDSEGQQQNVTKTSGGGRKSSVGGLQLTQARYSVTSSKKGKGDSKTRRMSPIKDVKEV